MYSFNKSSKNKNNWLKNILIDNSDESDEDIGQSVQELLKIRKYKNKHLSSKQNNKINSNLSSTVLSLNDSVPLNSLFKNEKSFKSQIKKQKTNRKKMKSGLLKFSLTELNFQLIQITIIDLFTDSNDLINDKLNECNNYRTYSSISNYFEPTIKEPTSDNFNLKKDYSDNEINNLDAGCLESKLLDDIKYETALTDDLLQNETNNMNDFVNSYLSNINDQIVYSNQLPDDIFETEEEISNGFHDLNKLNDNELNKFNNKQLTTADQLDNVSIEIATSTNKLIEPNVESKIQTMIEYRNCDINSSLKNNLNTNLNSNLNCNLNEVKIESSDEFKNAKTEMTIINEIPILETTNDLNNQEIKITEKQLNDKQKLNLTKINTINIINSATPLNTISITNLVNPTGITVNSQLINPTINATLNPTINSILTTTIPTTNLTISPSTAKISLSNSICPKPVVDQSNETISSKLNKMIKKKEKVNCSKSLLENEPEHVQNKRRKLWSSIVKKDIIKAYKSRMMNKKEILNNCKKLATLCQKERKNVIGIPKLNRERSKKSNKEIATYWKLNKRNETDLTATTQIKPQLFSKLNENIINECNQEIKPTNSK